MKPPTMEELLRGVSEQDRRLFASLPADRRARTLEQFGQLQRDPSSWGANPDNWLSASAPGVAPLDDSKIAQQEENWLSPQPATPAPAPTPIAPAPVSTVGIPAPVDAIGSVAANAGKASADAAISGGDWLNIDKRVIESPAGPVPKSIYNAGIEVAKRAGSMGGGAAGAAAGAAGGAAAGAAGGPMGMMAGVGMSLLGSLLSKVLSPDPAPEPVDTLDLQPAAPYEAPEPPTFADARDVDRRLFGWA